MSLLSSLPRRAGVVAGGAAVLVTGAAVGLAAERYTVGRSLRGRPDPLADEGFGCLRGRVVPVTADDGTVLHVEVDELAGPSSVTVVLVHGYSLSMDFWHFQRRDLDDLGRLVLYDQRGHGRSPVGPVDHLNVEQLGSDLARVLEVTAPTGSVVLVGHSMGGMAVMALAEAHPEWFGARIVGVALLSTSAGGIDEVNWGVPAPLARVVHRVTPEVLGLLAHRQGLVATGRRFTSDLEYVLTRRLSFGSDVSPSLVRFVAQMITATPVEVLAAFFPQLDRADQRPALVNVDGVETLVMVGTADALTPPRHSQAIVDLLPGAELVLLPGAGHLAPLEVPVPVNEHLRRLVARAVRVNRNEVA